MENNYNSLRITCPTCQKDGVFDYKALVYADEKTRKEFMDNLEAFTYTCPFCNQDSIITYDFSYYDLEKKLIISIASDDKKIEDTINYFIAIDRLTDDSLIEYNTFTKRLVLSARDLKEKLEIFYNNLDDRVIEYYKVKILEAYTKEDVEIEEIYFTKEEGKKSFYIEDRYNYDYIDFSKKTYDKLKKDLEEKEIYFEYEYLIDNNFIKDLVK